MINPNLDELVGPIDSPYSGLTSCSQYPEARGFLRVNNTATAVRLLEVLAGTQDKFRQISGDEELKVNSVHGIGYIAAAVAETFPDVRNPGSIHLADFSWPEEVIYAASGQFLEMLERMTNDPEANHTETINFSYNTLTAARLMEIMAGFQKVLHEGIAGHYSDLTPANPVNEQLRLSAVRGIGHLSSALITDFPYTVSPVPVAIAEGDFITTYHADNLFINTVEGMIAQIS